ncbi:MAG: hypothetical protein B7X41_06055 [Microbacterium sp. 14-71-5]|jgi:hypothetical protein|nr:MAG: hypothetical protein B7X41_06055 [Microbacterium sp. 14-71-5]
MPLDWDVGGFEAFMDDIVGRVDAAVPFAVGRAAEHIRAKSTELAPVLTGNLRASAEVKAVSHTEFRVYYPGPYARYQHYGLDFKHPQGGQALFLQQPMLTERDACLQIIADTIREAMG